ncbi:MAG: hypothetical protein WC554_09285 [Clostridia bacterium]
MSNTLKYTIREILDELDGAGLVITDQDEINNTLKDMGINIETEVQTIELED